MVPRARVAALLTAALLPALAVPAAHASPGSKQAAVVTMGDSYISGEGAYDYMASTDVHGGSDENLCHRSPNSWAAKLAKT